MKKELLENLEKDYIILDERINCLYKSFFEIYKHRAKEELDIKYEEILNLRKMKNIIEETVWKILKIKEV